MHGILGKGAQGWRYSPHHAREVVDDFHVEEERECMSALLRVAWRRIVLDEGHVMGASADSNKALMCAGMCV
jgi:hypothetical protein